MFIELNLSVYAFFQNLPPETKPADTIVLPETVYNQFQERDFLETAVPKTEYQCPPILCTSRVISSCCGAKPLKLSISESTAALKSSLSA